MARYMKWPCSKCGLLTDFEDDLENRKSFPERRTWINVDARELPVFFRVTHCRECFAAKRDITEGENFYKTVEIEESALNGVLDRKKSLESECEQLKRRLAEATELTAKLHQVLRPSK
jgi:hypothetical protein